MNFLSTFQVKNLALRNRIVLPPMCLYTAASDGMVTERHLVHYISRAIGGTGLIILEATGVQPNGRISGNCLGLWDDSQVDGLQNVVQGCQSEGAKIAIQLNHAGRKCTAEPDKTDYTVSASALAFDESYRVPRGITKEEIAEVVASFAKAAERAGRAGFDAIEIHGAHGYLISSFLSPITNQRRDEYGGSLENRARLLLEVLKAVREVWPAEKALLLRLSATDCLPGGISLEETIQVIEMAKRYIDIAHISSGGIAPAPIQVFPGYQVPLAEAVRKACGLPVIAVGRIRRVEMVEEILGNQRADLVALGKEQFRNPYWVTHNAWDCGMEYPWPDIYHEAYGRKA